MAATMASASSPQQDNDHIPVPISRTTKDDINRFIGQMSGEGRGNRGDFFYTRFAAVNDLRCPFSACSERDLVPESFEAEGLGRPIVGPTVAAGELARNIFQKPITKLHKALEDGHYTKADKQLAAIMEYMECYNGRRENGDAFRIGKVEDKNCIYESEIATVLVNHVLRKLASNRTYCLDDQISHQLEKCFCGCGEVINYDNTSIGSDSVFHGRIDAFVGDVPCVTANVIEDEEETEADVYPDSKAGLRAINQATAICLVFSFYQQYHNKGTRQAPQKGLFPTILLFKRQFSVYLYDSVNDILLRSQPMRLHNHGILDKHALFYLWCVLSCDFVSPDERAVKFKSGFHDLSSGIYFYREHIVRGIHYRQVETNDPFLTQYPIPLLPANFACTPDTQ